jgi:hypothetical protein
VSDLALFERDRSSRTFMTKGSTVSASGELAVTFIGNGAGVRVSVVIGPTPDPGKEEVTPLTLAQHQALSHIVHGALATLQTDLQLVLGETKGAN